MRSGLWKALSIFYITFDALWASKIQDNLTRPTTDKIQRNPINPNDEKFSIEHEIEARQYLSYKKQIKSTQTF